MSKDYLRRQVDKFERLEVVFTTIFSVVTFLLGRFFVSINIVSAIVIGIFLGLFSELMIDLIYWARKRGSNFHKGLKGEQNIEKILKHLPASYRYLKSSKLPYNDFLIIGDCGIFCLEVKNISGKITYDKTNKELLRNQNFFDKNYLKQVKGCAVQANQLLIEGLKLNIFVKPVLVFVDKGVYLDMEKEVDDVDVINSDQLLQYFKTYSVSSSILTTELKEKIYNFFL